MRKLNFMKNIIILAISCIILSSCSNIKSDAFEKACDFTTQIMEMMPQMMELSMAGFGDEDSKKLGSKRA